MKREPILVIMAAGLGSRYGGLKQMAPITLEKEILLDFALYDAIRAGFKRVIFVIKKEIEEDFKKLIEGNSDKYIDVQYAYQELSHVPEDFVFPEGRIKPWGTSHAVLSACRLIDANFCVINSDDFYGPAAFETAYNYLVELEDKEEKEYGMVGYLVEKTLSDKGSVTRGVCEVDENGYLLLINERKNMKRMGEDIVYSKDGMEPFTKISEGTTVSMNFWLFEESFKDELLRMFEDFLKDDLKKDPLNAEWLLPDTIERLLTEKKVKIKVMESKDKWEGMTYKEDLDHVRNAMGNLKKKGLYPEKLWG